MLGVCIAALSGATPRSLVYTRQWGAWFSKVLVWLSTTKCPRPLIHQPFEPPRVPMALVSRSRLLGTYPQYLVWSIYDQMLAKKTHFPILPCGAAMHTSERSSSSDAVQLIVMPAVFTIGVLRRCGLKPTSTERCQETGARYESTKLLHDFRLSSAGLTR